MGYKDRSAIFKYKESLGQNIVFKYDCMIIFDGRITGTWKRKIKKKQIEGGAIQIVASNKYLCVHNKNSML
jgi:hypothetical protein